MLTQERAICLLSNQQRALKPSAGSSSSMDGGGSEETTEGGGGREEETPAEGVWQSSDGGMGRGTLNLLEEEVWRKGLGETERESTQRVSLTWPPRFSLPTSAHSDMTVSHTNPIILTQPFSLSYSPRVKVPLRKLWQMWWYRLQKYFLCPSATEIQRKQAA